MPFTSAFALAWAQRPPSTFRDGEIEDGAEGFRIIVPDNNIAATFGRGITSIEAAYRRGKLISVCAGEICARLVL
ncbi:hypothetical protein BP5796_13088 [Coleophoma crateriformis]|uniref:Uncharacterized protein n=1 Tax=Coleophoma crateriformis TaxID=565419 RepID=A0A3D8Q455_9HELO|nr:hypothetical protein BP5796_13088 [Coleophoma crateriformis]